LRGIQSTIRALSPFSISFFFTNVIVLFTSFYHLLYFIYFNLRDLWPIVYFTPTDLQSDGSAVGTQPASLHHEYLALLDDATLADVELVLGPNRTMYALNPMVGTSTSNHLSGCIVCGSLWTCIFVFDRHPQSYSQP